LLSNITLTQQENYLAGKSSRVEYLKELPENRPAMLLSSIYVGDEQKVYLKFYDLQERSIFFWRDRTNHKPYCYTKMRFLDT